MPLFYIVVVCAILIALVFFVGRRRVEGFANSPGVLEQMKFNDTFGKFFEDRVEKGLTTNPGLNLGILNDAMRTLDPYLPKVPDRDFKSYFMEDPKHKVDIENANCAGALSPRDLPPLKEGGTLGCGWWYVSDTTQKSVPAFGTTAGPAFPSDLPSGGQWIWDRDEALKLEDIKFCRGVKSCDLMSASGVKDRCGFCRDLGHAIPMKSDGTQKYPETEGANCGTDLIRDAGYCNLPTFPTNYVATNGTFCGNYGKPSADGNLRLYDANECHRLDGVFKDGGICLKPGNAGSFSADCKELNGPTPPRNNPNNPIPPALCDPVNGKLTRACLKSMVVGAGYKQSGAVYRILDGQTKTESDVLAIKMAARAGYTFPDGTTSITREDASTKFIELRNGLERVKDQVVHAAISYLVEGTRDFDFCNYSKDATGPYELECIQRAFRKAGCQAAGKKYPQSVTGFANKKWGDIVDSFKKLFSDTKSKDVLTQNNAMEDCMGITYKRKAQLPCDSDAVQDCRFDANAYLQAYPDVQDIARRNNWNPTQVAIDHFIGWGLDMGRSPCGKIMPDCKFDPIQYGNINTDVKYSSFYGKNRKMIKQHYIDTGLKEGRVICRRGAKVKTDEAGLDIYDTKLWEIMIKGRWRRDNQRRKYDQVAIGLDESIWAIRTNEIGQNLYRKKGPYAEWVKHNPYGENIVHVDAQSQTFAVVTTRDGRAWIWNGSTFTHIGNKTHMMSAGSDGTIWGLGGEYNALNGGYQIWRYLGTPFKWELIPGWATYISVADKDTVYHSNSAFAAFKLTGPKTWARFSTFKPARIIEAGANGMVVIVDNENRALVWGGEHWHWIPGRFKTMSVGNTFLAATTTNDDIVYLDLSEDISNFSYMGCFKDVPGNRTLPDFLGKVTTREECEAKAISGKYDTYGLQFNGECFAGKTSEYDKYGPEFQDCGDLGIGSANKVYKQLDGSGLDVFNRPASVLAKYGDGPWGKIWWPEFPDDGTAKWIWTHTTALTNEPAVGEPRHFYKKYTNDTGSPIVATLYLTIDDGGTVNLNDTKIGDLANGQNKVAYNITLRPGMNILHVAGFNSVSAAGVLAICKRQGTTLFVTDETWTTPDIQEDPSSAGLVDATELDNYGKWWPQAFTDAGAKAKWIWNNEDAVENDPNRNFISLVKTYNNTGDVERDVDFHVNVDDVAVFMFNGKTMTEEFTGVKVIKVRMRHGLNTFHMRVANRGGPAGLLAMCKDHQGSQIYFVSDRSWKVTPGPPGPANQCKFDPIKYRDGEPDLQILFRQRNEYDNVAAIEDHYRKIGYKEDRSPCGKDMPDCRFSPGEYSSLNPDVKAAAGSHPNKFVNGAAGGEPNFITNHLRENGLREKRTICKRNYKPVNAGCSFDPNLYLQANPDVQDIARRNNWNPTQVAIDHYKGWGRDMGRSPCGNLMPNCQFSVGQYALLNPDLKAAFGDDKKKIANHFFEWGMTEGRSVCSTETMHYRKKNAHNAVMWGSWVTGGRIPVQKTFELGRGFTYYAIEEGQYTKIVEISTSGEQRPFYYTGKIKDYPNMPMTNAPEGAYKISFE